MKNKTEKITKLSEFQVRKINAMLKNGYTAKSVSKQMGVSVIAVNRVSQF